MFVGMLFSGSATAQTDTSAAARDTAVRAILPDSGPVPCAANPITSGYGAHGPFDVCHDSVASSSMRGGFVHLFRPCRGDTLWPTVFFLHGIGAHDPVNYLELLEHLSSRGHAVIFSPYAQALAMARPQAAYKMLREGFEQGVGQWRPLLDSSRVGFVGHSYGAGAIPAISYYWTSGNGWGKAGTFLYSMAPYYSYEITKRQLAAFPDNATLIVQVFEDDYINDHRMAKDIFDNIGIPLTHKNFIVLHSDSSEGLQLNAVHDVPQGIAAGLKCDMLDFYGVWRLVDALADYSLRNDTAARSIALGSGSRAQMFMGVWPNGKPVRELTAAHTAFVLHPQNRFLNFWNHDRNPRYKEATVFEDRTRPRQRRYTTIRNYMTIRPGSAGSPESLKTVRSEDSAIFTPIESGYGALGPYTVTKRTFPHPGLGHGKVYIVSPQGMDRAAPVIVFLHGFTWPMPDYYQGLITNIASQGYHVVFPSYLLYRMVAGNRRLYDLMVSGTEEAFGILGANADTSRIGFIGHSYGAGAVPAIAWHFLKLRSWGKEGAFMFIVAPWYVYNFKPYQFSTFPDHVRLLVEVFEGDHFNDWRMAEDLFYSFETIPDRNRDFIIVHNDYYGDEELEAEHTSPLSGGDDDIDAIDHYALYRMAGALAAASFEKSEEAHAVALGNGSALQTDMGTWPDGTPVTRLTVTDRPVTPHHQSTFLFSWYRLWNKRRRHYTPIEKARPPWLYRIKKEQVRSRCLREPQAAGEFLRRLRHIRWLRLSKPPLSRRCTFLRDLTPNPSPPGEGRTMEHEFFPCSWNEHEYLALWERSFRHCRKVRSKASKRPVLHKTDNLCIFSRDSPPFSAPVRIYLLLRSRRAVKRHKKSAGRYKNIPTLREKVREPSKKSL